MIKASRLNRMVFALAIAVGASARAELIHRYSFSEATVKDSVGKVDATLKGEAKVADGKLVIDNAEKTSADAKLSYLEFNSPIVPKSGSCSLAIWIKAKENPQFSRVLDIGETVSGEGNAFIYLVPRHEEDQSRAAITAGDTGSKSYVPGKRLDDNQLHLAVIVIDGTAKKLHLYVDGKEAGNAEDLNGNTLDQVHPVHSWIGRSSFDADPGLTASIDEIRVYDQALSADEVNALQQAGADKVPAAPVKNSRAGVR